MARGLLLLLVLQDFLRLVVGSSVSIDASGALRLLPDLPAVGPNDLLAEQAALAAREARRKAEVMSLRRQLIAMVTSSNRTSHALGNELDLAKALAKAKQEVVPELRQSVRGSTPTGPVQLGTPGVKVGMIFDTGSDKFLVKTWETVQKELQMVDASLTNSVKPTSLLYDHNRSSTYQTHYKHGAPAIGLIVYGSGYATTAEGSDYVRAGGAMLRDFPISEITHDSLRLLHTPEAISGVLGLQHMRNSSVGTSLFSTLRDAGLMTAMGYCRGQNDSTFIWSDRSSEGMAVPVIGEIHWAVKLSQVRLDVTSDQGSSSSKKDKDEDDDDDDDDNDDTEEEDIKGSKSKHKVLVDGLPRSQPEGTRASLPSSYSRGKYKAAEVDEASLLQIAAEVPVTYCSGGPCAAVIDTGSNIIGMPTAALRDLTKRLKVKYDCSNLNSLPDLLLKLGEVSVTIPASSYVMKVKLPKLGDRDSDNGDSDPSNAKEDPQGELMQGARSSAEMLRQRLEDKSLDLDSLLAFKHDPLEDILKISTLCMPAFVSMDEPTRAGDLWVIGTPLFDGYYTRFSWNTGDDRPTIFLSDLATSSTCRNQTTIVAEPKARVLIRSESRRATPAPKVQATVSEIYLGEIRYPRWLANWTGI